MEVFSFTMAITILLYGGAIMKWVNKLLSKSELRTTVLSQIHVNQDRFMKLLEKINEDRDKIKILEDQMERIYILAKNQARDIDALQKRRWWQ